MIKIGFTGTQNGMSHQQLVAFMAIIKRVDGFELHHGDCIGADADAARLARYANYQIIGHPPTNDSKRAFFPSDQECPIRSYLVRNHDIVDQTSVLIAAPQTYTEKQRSGTWATIRYAKKQGKKVIIINPNGGLVLIGSTNDNL